MDSLVFIGSDTTIGSILQMGSVLCAGVVPSETVAGIANSMLLFAFMFLALVATITSYTFRKQQIAWVAAAGWFLLAIISFQQSASSNPILITDVYMGLFWIGIAMTIVSAFEPVVMKPADDKLEQLKYDNDDNLLGNEIENMRKEMEANRIFRPRTKRKDRKLK